MFQLLLTIQWILLAGHSQGQSFEGFALYNLMNSNTTYLIDENGDIVHRWNCSLPCNYTVLLKENGNIIRGATNPGNILNGAAVGGMIQELDSASNVVWSFTYSNAQHVSHHDIAAMPNGNVLLTAWEVKSSTELQARGYAGTASTKYPTHIIEVAQNGTGGQIVWEWHLWDHMIQDRDSTLPNYGVVADHPELMDINVPVSGLGGGPGGSSGDWFHVNGLDYNEDLDQITFSSRYLSEIFIIDHSTTTNEAAGHTGGNSGKGGDLLYRWGNPSNYDAPGTRRIPGPVHDSHWVPNDGRRFGGYLQIFNNQGVSSNASAVDVIQTPISGYNYTLNPGQSYEPANYNWRHNTRTYGSGQSASVTMPNGNLFVAVSGKYMYEVDSLGSLIWQYNAGPPKAARYTCDYPGITALLGTNPCNTLAVDEKEIDHFGIFPNPTTGAVTLSGLHLDQRNVEIYVKDLFGKTIFHGTNTSTIDLSSQPNGIYLVTVQVVDGNSTTQKLILAR